MAIVAIAALIYNMYARVEYAGESSCWVYIPAGADSDSVSAILDRDLGRAGRRAADMWRLYGGSPLVAHGAYRIDPGTRSIDIFRRVARGAQTPVRITFNNIRQLPQLGARISRSIEADSAHVMAAIDSVLSTRGYKSEEYIGAFFPDTYEFYWTARPADVVTSLIAERESFWTDKRRSRAASLGITPMQASVIASIAEEETNDRGERGVVGRLYLNRLHRGMLLQADPTVKYAVGDFSIRRVTGRHLAVNSPYNTYRSSGLPPGPIRMPERATIDSLLFSTPHDCLYMCASPDFSGRHLFARDFAAHKRNAEAYHRALNRRNIK
ncbi:endolytic transglycosylase MltG [uncultured Muribaculum sp.]|uniref:endolytic transglycosylase MltG n=1 Tax=uncultured Muribaculum sp. TaxID=1918613 RepID=UPI00262EFC72|nr:endolytic transglycosylase MltG [uncultured Muribaculum sp.]